MRNTLLNFQKALQKNILNYNIEFLLNMNKRNEGILDLLFELPWWCSVIVSATIYVILKWVLPIFSFDNIFFQGTAQAAPNVAAYFALVLLLPAPFSFFNSWRKKQQLDKQKSIESIRSLSWKQFEEIIAEVFRRKGYSVLENSGIGPDGGVDIELKKDGSLFLIQCKHWKNSKVGVRVVREMYGVMVAKQATGVIIITSGFFTQEAQHFAREKPQEPLGSFSFEFDGDDPVEFRPRDVMQIIIGSAILAVPVGFTEETWKLGESLPWLNVIALLVVSLIFISLFVYHNYYRNSPKENPTGPEKGKFRVIRGGGWHSGPSCNRVYYRNALPANWRDYNVGFRCAKDATPDPASKTTP